MHDDLEDDLYVGGVGGRGEVWVDHLTLVKDLPQEQHLDEDGR